MFGFRRLRFLSAFVSSYYPTAVELKFGVECGEVFMHFKKNNVENKNLSSTVPSFCCLKVQENNINASVITNEYYSCARPVPVSIETKQ